MSEMIRLNKRAKPKYMHVKYKDIATIKIKGYSLTLIKRKQECCKSITQCRFQSKDYNQV